MLFKGGLDVSLRLKAPFALLNKHVYSDLVPWADVKGFIFIFMEMLP